MKPHQWLQLKLKVPQDYERICRLCYEFMKLEQSFRAVKYQVTGMDISEFQSKVHRILAEYLAISKMIGATEKTMIDIKKDINITFSVFLEKGEFKNLTEPLARHRRSKDMDIYLSQMMNPFISFIDARIYDSLEEAMEKTKGIFHTYFITWSCNKAGIYPDIKGGISMAPTPVQPSKKEKEDKEK